MMHWAAINKMDYFRDWLFPLVWRNKSRFVEFWKTCSTCADKFLEGKKDESWHLAELGVMPEFQKQGIGGQLLDWGLDHARERKEKVYTEASEAGERLYSKKGFHVVGYVSVHDPDTGENF